MPGFTPGRRWQPPYFPFKREPFNRRMLAALELAVKGPLFGCRMCGNCLLQETAFICPMECPKGLRNGPCGGSTPEWCYVDETRPCVWYKIYERSFAMHREALLLEVLPPLDWEKVGTETWGDVFAQIQKIGFKRIFSGLLTKDTHLRAATWDSIFQPVRQPEWWHGDAQYHVPTYDQPVSELEQKLKAGEFVVTAEITPPMSLATDKFINHIESIKSITAALNFTDAASAIPRMSSWACAKIAFEHGAEPIMQIAARDKTRVGLQNDVMGASALGIKNMMCLTGDSMILSGSPRGRMDIVDLDSIQMLWLMRKMRDNGKYLDGREMKVPPQYFLGAAASPLASNPKFQALREEKKVNAGAQFFQTNVIFDTNQLETWLGEIAARNILDKVYILIGIMPLKSFKMAQYMNKNLPGIFVPEAVLKRMQTAEEKGNAKEEGLLISLELIEKLKTKQGVNGIHIMTAGWEEIIPRLIKESRLLPRSAATV